MMMSERGREKGEEGRNGGGVGHRSIVHCQSRDVVSGLSRVCKACPAERQGARLCE